VVNPDVIRLRNQQDGRCPEIKDFNQSNGAPLQVWDCSSDWYQDFGLNFS
jgi:hypothetical protein